MCVRIYYNIDLDVLKSKYSCVKILNNEKLKKGMINKKNYLPIIYESNENSVRKKNQLQKNDKLINVCIWGINPFNYGKFEKDVALINARLDTIHLKKSFKILINKNRCAIIVNGYFEWKNNGNSKKVPYYIFSGDNNDHQTKKNKQLDDKNDKEVIEEENNKNNAVADNENNTEQEDAELIDRETRKRKKAILEEKVTKKIKIESSDGEPRKNDSFIIIAGLYTISEDDKKECRSTVITTSSENTNLKDIHDRSPLLLNEKSLPLWINVENSYLDIIDKLKEEHICACSNLKYKEVQVWSDYSNYSNKEKKIF